MALLRLSVLSMRGVDGSLDFSTRIDNCRECVSAKLQTHAENAASASLLPGRFQTTGYPKYKRSSLSGGRVVQKSSKCPIGSSKVSSNNRTQRASEIKRSSKARVLVGILTCRPFQARTTISMGIPSAGLMDCTTLCAGRPPPTWFSINFWDTRTSMSSPSIRPTRSPRHRRWP